MNPNQPRKDDVILGGQTRVPFGAAVLGGLFGFKWRLANGSEEQRLAALSEVLKYKEGYDLLTQQALKDNSEKVQQSAYWVLHGQNPYLSELFEKRSPNESVVPTDTVSCVAISADNQTLAGGSWKIVRLWRFGTGELLRTLDAHSQWVLSVVISPDGNTLASGSADKTIKLWNLKTGQVIQTLTSHSSWVNVVAISPDGQTLISGSADKTIKLWELNTGKLLRTLKGHSGSVCSLAVSPDGQTVASGSTDKTIKLWDLSTGKLLRTLEESSDWVQAVAIGSDGETLVSGSRDGSIKIWKADSQDNKPVPKFSSQALKCIKTISEHSSSINSLTISTDGLTFVTGSNDNTIKLWNLNTKKPLIGHSGFISSVAISPDGKTLASGSNDWAMHWNLKTGELLHPLKGYSRPRLSSIVVSPSPVQLEFAQSQIFSVRGLDQNGQEMNLGQVVWQATSGNIDTNGLFLAGQSEGNFTITATVGLFKGSASVTVVEPLRLTRLVITPQKVHLELGQRQTFSVRGLDQRGDEINIGQVSWYATGGAISTNGIFQAGQNSGNFEVIATVGEISGYAFVTVVEPPKLTTLVVSPEQVQLKPEQRQRFTVRGLDQHGREIALARVAWKATGGKIDQNGTFIAGHNAKGNFTVTASVGHISGLASVTVLPVLTQLEISPQEVQLKPEERLTFTVRGLDQQGDEIEVWNADWECTTGGRIDRNGVFIGGYEKREVRVTATVETISDSAKVTFLPVLKRLEIFPKQVQLKPKENQSFTIKGFDQYGKEIEIQTVNWNTTGGNIYPDGTFLAGNKEGSFTITAIVENIHESASITVVEPAKLTSLVISPQQVEMKPDQHQRFTVRGLDQHGREIGIGCVVWSATGGRIEPDGSFSASYNENANFTVTATVGEFKGYAKVSIVAPQRPQSLEFPQLPGQVFSFWVPGQPLISRVGNQRPHERTLERVYEDTSSDSINIQSNDVLELIAQLESEFDFLIENEEANRDELVDTQPDKEDDKSGKGRSTRHRIQTKKKHYTEDSIRLYLQEIGQIRLLRADEEIELARKIADLLELERVRERLMARLDQEPQDSEWATEVNMTLPAFRHRLYLGRQAKDKMVQSNLRLVVSIANKYMNRGLSFQDLIQEGNLGLIRAAEKFDHEKGYKFSTYAMWWIRQAITIAIADQSRTIRLPIHLYETISRIKKTTKILSQEMGRKPTEEEIADRMDMTIEKLRFIAKSAQLPISLETPIDTEENSRLGDFIESDDETPEDYVYKRFLREDIESVLDTLSAGERDVLRLRYGLDDGRMKTLEEIGQIFNVTRERIRQIEANALRKLRHSSRNSILKEYIR